MSNMDLLDSCGNLGHQDHRSINISIYEYLYLAINKAKFALLRGFRTEDQGVRTED